MVSWQSESPQQTRAIARSLAAALDPPVCIALIGDLGAGKTTFVRGLVEGWDGAIEQVSSPTYVLLQCYTSGRGDIFHLDAYRINGADDFEAIGFDELVGQRAMIVVEWPERVQSLLPRGTIEIQIRATAAHRRQIVWK